MTKEERLLCALGDVGDDLIARAAEKPKRSRWRSFAAMAACLVLVIGAVRVLPMMGMGGAASDGSSGAGYDTAAMDNGAPLAVGEAQEKAAAVEYDAYMGPVMPLSLTEPAEGITAERDVTYDFSAYTETHDHTYRIHADVTDSYLLTNCTDGDITVTAEYPVMAKLSDFDVLLPDVTVDGVPAVTDTVVGDELNRADYIGSGTELMDVLSDGSCYAPVSVDTPELTRAVTVYSVTELSYDGPVGDNPTLALDFVIDPDRSSVLMGGSCATRYDSDAGSYRLLLNVMDFIYGDDIHVVILGDDVEGYTMQGYSSMACERGDEVDGFQAEIVRREMSLGDFLAEYVDWTSWRNAYNDGNRKCIAAGLTAGELMSLTAALMEDLEPGNVNGMYLSDYISAALYEGRMLYTRFQVTIPAGSSVTVSAEMAKYPSSSFGGRDEDSHGYDLVTGLGSVPEITKQTVRLVNTENVALIDNSFGFDLDAGVTEVTLDPHVKYYWMQLCEIG